MGRKKVKHELISNEYVRRTTFRKRKAGLLKKLSELTTLCGIMACGIIYSSYDPQPDVWPCPQEACRMLERFKNLPAKKQGKYMMDQKDFLDKSISKLNGRLETENKGNREALDMELLLIGFLADKKSCSSEVLTEIGHILDEKMNFLTKRIEFIKGFRPTKLMADDDNKKRVEHGLEKGFPRNYSGCYL
jgi:hypothetical protein